MTSTCVDCRVNQTSGVVCDDCARGDKLWRRERIALAVLPLALEHSDRAPAGMDPVAFAARAAVQAADALIAELDK